ncbi:MAG: hypothetical protein JSW33_00595 [bacterium]|nr:MAG: hypothetical protein JSW33_00595 [bacterium]
MAIRIKIIKPSGPIVMTASGNIGSKEIVKALQRTLTDPDFKKGMDILWDFQAVNESLVDTQEILDIVTFIKNHQDTRGSNYRVALVVSRDLDYGLARMYEAYSQGLPCQIQIFKNLNAAKNWLAENRQTGEPVKE